MAAKVAPRPETPSPESESSPSSHGHRVQVTFTEAQWALIHGLRGIMGDSDAMVVRNLVLVWMAEKSLLSSVAKERLFGLPPPDADLQGAVSSAWQQFEIRDRQRRAAAGKPDKTAAKAARGPA